MLHLTSVDRSADVAKFWNATLDKPSRLSRDFRSLAECCVACEAECESPRAMVNESESESVNGCIMSESDQFQS